MRALLNPAVKRDAAFRGLFSAADYAAVAAFYDSQPSRPPTPLLDYPSLAKSMNIAALWVKDETHRFGLEAFKALGAFYAMDRLPRDPLQKEIVCATAGNHGRAVARATREHGIGCTVFVPSLPADAASEELSIREARMEGMRADGAAVVDVTGSYEDAVQRAAAWAARTGATIVSDTSWPGYEEIPRHIMAGYARLFGEAADQWPAVPDVVIVQAGVGGLLCAAASWFAFHMATDRPFLIACEPDGYACVLESAAAGGPVRLADGGGPPLPPTCMAGLRCSAPSRAAWPTLRDGVDAFVSIPDAFALRAIEELAAAPGARPIAAGPSGACGVGALLALASEPVLRHVREACGWGRSTRVLAIVTEGK